MIKFSQAIRYDEETKHLEIKLRKPKTDDILNRLKPCIHGINNLLCLSGGLDSQAQALLMKEHNMDFRAVTYASKWGIQTINAYDVMTAQAFCQKHDIQHEVYDIDYQTFLNTNKHMEYAETYGTTSPQIAFHLFFLDQLKHEGTLHMGGDIPLMYLNNDNKVKMKANSSLLLNVSMIYKKYATYNNNIALVKDSLMSNPEIMYLAFMNNIRTTQKFGVVCHLADSYRQGMQQYKERYYKTLGLDVSVPLLKYTGFEILKKHLASKTGNYDEYDRLYRVPMQQFVTDKPDLSKIVTRIKGPQVELIRELEKVIESESPKMLTEYVFDF